MGILKEVWAGELLDHFRHESEWLSEIPSADQYVNNNLIHLVDIGADPDVLIDNAVYPIATSDRTDSDVAVALKKFDTTNTKITDDELYALPYDKQGSVIRQHREGLEEKTSEYGLYSLAPAGDTANTPIIPTTGADNGNSRKKLMPADIIKAKKKLDDLKVPKKGRVLVLCSDHVEDLLNTSEAFEKQYKDITSGTVLNLYGFKIYEDVYNPVYDATNAKKAFGAASAGTDRNASTFFYAPRAFKATGSVKMFASKAENDPENRESKVGFRLYHIVLPKKNVGFGAIVSDATA